MKKDLSLLLLILFHTSIFGKGSIMKKAAFFLLIAFITWANVCFSQVYIPMPTDSAVWRYRSLVVDNLITSDDFILYVNGTDTVIGGITYHKIFSRNASQTGTFVPPVVSIVATAPDVYFGGIRESAKKVYYITSGAEQMIFNFNAVVGDYIPSSTSTVRVTSIDSVLIDGVYHKRYNTADSTYYVVEGVGSNRGLIPPLDDGSGLVTFQCFTRLPDTVWSPNATIPCTSVYPFGQGASVKNISNVIEVNIYPNPVSEELHVANLGVGDITVIISNSVGQAIWKGEISDKLSISASRWPRGIYYIQFRNRASATVVKKFAVD